jgi:hypothetical protein
MKLNTSILFVFIIIFSLVGINYLMIENKPEIKEGIRYKCDDCGALWDYSAIGFDPEKGGDGKSCPVCHSSNITVTEWGYREPIHYS